MNYEIANSMEPFLFEPIENESIASNDTRNNSLDMTNNEKQQHDDCTCRICDRNDNSMTANELVCYKQWNVIEDKLQHIECITIHEEFNILCLNRTVLKAIWPYIMAFRRQRGRIPNDLNNKLVI